LPTNPDTKVHGIDPDSSTPLQSAAKVPIMVSFQCHTRDDEVETEDPDNKDRKLVSWKRAFKQACIFKVGDDVRQDMLAVQIIELFKRIFDHVGLELFLYPYKVIATKPGVRSYKIVPGNYRDQCFFLRNIDSGVSSHNKLTFSSVD
jgi:phosphatidylinositol 4-kinase